MGRNYTQKCNKKRTYGYCYEEDLKKAVTAINAGMSLRKAAVEFNVKRSTLHDRVVGKHPKKAGQSIDLYFYSGFFYLI